MAEGGSLKQQTGDETGLQHGMQNLAIHSDNDSPSVPPRLPAGTDIVMIFLHALI